MNDRPIQVGDLVIIVRPTVCCGNPRSVGRIFKILRVWTTGATCPCCQTRTSITGARMTSKTSQTGFATIALSRLKRIDPPALTEETEIGERVTA